jgi:hypothetical protein
MGRTKVNQREVVTPLPRMKVAELKELALVPASDKLYDKTGRVLRDDEIVATDDAEFGAVTDWTRGNDSRPDDQAERCAVCGEPILDPDNVAYDFDHGRILPRHAAYLPTD